MRPIVFAGPSLFGIDRSTFALDFRPPARCGDLLNAAQSGAVAIGLIDGYFEGARSVWHKEILFALAAGIEVLGAASMGALRAAECHEFGMEGFGRIFEEYALGARIEDADVALLHAPAEMDYAPLTVALVDVEATIDWLGDREMLSLADLGAILDAAHGLNYKERTWPAICDSAGVDSRTRDIIEGTQVSRKRDDALLLLKELERRPQSVSGEGRAWPSTLSRTTYFRQLELELGKQR